MCPQLLLVSMLCILFTSPALEGLPGDGEQRPPLTAPSCSWCRAFSIKYLRVVLVFDNVGMVYRSLVVPKLLTNSEHVVMNEAYYAIRTMWCDMAACVWFDMVACADTVSLVGCDVAACVWFCLTWLLVLALAGTEGEESDGAEARRGHPPHRRGDRPGLQGQDR